MSEQPLQSVVIEFEYGSTDLSALHAVEDMIQEILQHFGVGFLDGDLIAVDGSHGSIYLYGANADVVFGVIKAVLIGEECLGRPRAVLTYGDANDGDAPTKTVEVWRERGGRT